jgi:hypothetical protein
LDQEDEAKAADATLQKRVMYNYAIIKDLINPNAGQDSVQAFEEKIKQSKAKIVKRKWNAREQRLRKFSGMKGEDSFIQLRNSVIFILFIVVYIKML